MREEHLKEIKQVLMDAAAIIRSGSEQVKTASEQEPTTQYVIDLKAFELGAKHA